MPTEKFYFDNHSKKQLAELCVSRDDQLVGARLEVVRETSRVAKAEAEHLVLHERLHGEAERYLASERHLSRLRGELDAFREVLVKAGLVPDDTGVMQGEAGDIDTRAAEIAKRVYRRDG